MFDKQYRFFGSHAEKVNALTAVFDEDSKATLFQHNYDVYINAPIVGFLYKRKATRDKDAGKKNNVTQSIFAEQVIDNSDQLKYNLRLILLLDAQYEPDEQTRLDKAFRHLGEDDRDLALFDKYVLGGVDVLYEKLIEGPNTPDAYLGRLFDFLEEFHERFNAEISQQDILTLCSESKI